ncbi:hypothetical protein CDAR_209381 [Caerostris darwini]|uniref:Uncharacterized protein n=1 Tax=Caerostris darwini TaxID=1538125 RepID=A0AAV4N7J7_9ARAC|nr:hypothetical protein CDAR_209381 [Caerostris darwini]
MGVCPAIRISTDGHVPRIRLIPLIQRRRDVREEGSSRDYRNPTLTPLIHSNVPIPIPKFVFLSIIGESCQTKGGKCEDLNIDPSHVSLFNPWAYSRFCVSVLVADGSVLVYE